METLETIGKRTSLKSKLSSREIEPEKITKILEAARLAPSARNLQPWRFIVLQDKDLITDLVTRTFSEGNQVMKEAPVIIVACAHPDDDITRDGKGYYLHDVGMAMQNILLAATELGLATHPAANVSEADLKKILGIPDPVRFVLATPLAYPSGGSYNESAQERLSQRTRKDLSELVYRDSWGDPF